MSIFSTDAQKAEKQFLEISDNNLKTLINKKQQVNVLKNKFTEFQQSIKTKYVKNKSIPANLQNVYDVFVKLSKPKGVVDLLCKSIHTKKNSSFVNDVKKQMDNIDYKDIYYGPYTSDASKIADIKSKLKNLENSLSGYLSQKASKHPDLDDKIDQLKVIVTVWTLALISVTQSLIVQAAKSEIKKIPHEKIKILPATNTPTNQDA